MTKLELIKQINDLRKANKDKWVSQYIVYNGLPIGLKSYNTWVQILTVNDYRHSSNMDLTVKQFNEFLLEALKELD